MGNGMKNTIIFLGGAIVGAGIATLALRKFYTNYIENELTTEIDKELNQIKADYEERLNALIKSHDEIVEDFEALKKEKEEKKPAPKKAEKKKTSKENNTDYTQYSKSQKKVKDIKAKAIRQIQEDKKSNVSDAVIIGFDDYTEDNDYEKLTYTYWRQDGVYSDELDEDVKELPGIIGDLIDKYDDYGDGSSLYVRSDERQTDYEIVMNEGSYDEFMKQGEE